MFKNCCWSCSCSFPELQAAEHLIKAVFRIEREFQRFCNLYSSFVLNIIKEIYQIRQFLFVYPWLSFCSFVYNYLRAAICKGVFPPSSLAFTSAPLSSLNKQNSGNVHCTVFQGYIFFLKNPSHPFLNVMYVERVWLHNTSFGSKKLTLKNM